MDFPSWVKFISIPMIFIIFSALWNIQRQLTAIKLEMAKDYVSHKALRELEARLVKHLENIDHKIEAYINSYAPARED